MKTDPKEEIESTLVSWALAILLAALFSAVAYFLFTFAILFAKIWGTI